MTSTRRYMEQLDDSDEDDEGDGQKQGARSRQESNETIASRVETMRIGEEGDREHPVISQQSKDAGRAAVGIGRIENVNVGPSYPPLSRLQQQRPAPLKDPPPPRAPSNPIVKIGPPSPTTPELYSLESTMSSSRSPTSVPASSPTLPSFTASPRLSSNERVVSQTSQRNFSRPYNVSRQASNRTVRSNSIDSQDSRVQPASSLGHSGSSIGHSSSMDHAGSSQGGHSMSSSWDERQKMGFRMYQEKAQAARIPPSFQEPSPDLSTRAPVVCTTSDESREGMEHDSAGQASLSAMDNLANVNHPVYHMTEQHPFPRQSSPRQAPAIHVTDSPSKDSHRTSWRKLLHRSPKDGTGSPKQGTGASRPVSNITVTSEYSQTSSTPTIRQGSSSRTGPPLSTSSEQLSDLARRARDLTEHRRQFDDMLLKPSVARSAQASFVHAGEGGVSPDWLDRSRDEQSRMTEMQDLKKLHASAPLPMMRRTTSDQGATRTATPAEGQFDDSDRLSQYSEYTTVGTKQPQRTRKAESANSSPLLGMSNGLSSLSREVSVASHMTNDTLRKATMGLKGATPLRTASGQRADPESAYEYLQLGIEYHEAGELQRAAWCFEQSAKRNGGCAGGMLMYGLSLQHGWGCQVNAPLGFRYLQGAAESVVENLDRALADGPQAGFTAQTAQNELKLALYEMGQSFRFGYGVAKDKKMAVSYFQLAADLGDMDAQQDLAFCLANGKGCKKNPKLAAKYYRLAVKQGASDFGLSWIWKAKYDDEEQK
ncbi:hypothetical protein OIV83_002212 [Microbotryomycetes sp. JL201]|nr:hypothetical protein OIV83_002212 [Microbotryomycetes sp. JL201]